MNQGSLHLPIQTIHVQGQIPPKNTILVSVKFDTPKMRVPLYEPSANWRSPNTTKTNEP